MRRTQKSSKNNNKNVNKQQTVTSDASSTVPSGKETLEEIKAIFERLKNELKSRQSFPAACEEIAKLASQCLNATTRRLFYDALNVASYRIGRPGFSARIAQPMFQAVYDRIDIMTPGFRKYIEQWKKVVDHMANTGENTIPPSVDKNTVDGRFGTPHPSSTPRGPRVVDSANSATSIANLLLTLFPSLQRSESLSEDSSSDSLPRLGYEGTLLVGDNVITEIPFSQYPFYEFDTELAKPRKLKRNRANGTYCSTINYTLNSKVFEKLKSSPAMQVKLCVIDCISSVPRCVKPPSTLVYKVNGKEVNFSCLFSAMEIAYGVDITPHSRQGKNKIEIASNTHWHSFDFLSFAVRTVRIVSIEDLITKKKETGTLPYASCIQRVTESFKKSDCDVEQERIKLSLRCPLSLTRIQVPVRGTACCHIQCFDLGSYLQINKTLPTFKCPICNQPRGFSDLFVDSYFEKILCDATKEVDEVFIERDCTWKVMEQNQKQNNQSVPEGYMTKKRSKRKNSETNEVTSNFTEEPTLTSPTKRLRPSPQVIVLD